MPQVTTADLKPFISSYDSPRSMGDVLIGEDTARLLIEASLSGNNATLERLLSQPLWIKIILEEPHRIHHEERPSQGPHDIRSVTATPTLNLEHALTAAALNSHATVVSTLLSLAARQGIKASSVLSITTLSKMIRGGDVATIKAAVSAHPGIVNRRLGHGGELPLYEAVRLAQTDIVTVLLEFGADPLKLFDRPKQLGGYRSSLMSWAAIAGTRMTEILLEQGLPIAHTCALHSAAGYDRLDTMRLLIQRGADVNEVSSSGWTPMHYAAWRGQVDAMKLLEQNGARCDVKGRDGKTPAELLEEYEAARN